MARIHDLSVALRRSSMESRDITLTATTHDESARVFAKRYGVNVADIPQASLFASERIALGSHDGTHLDAPYHFYPTSEGRPAKFIDEVPLEWCLADAVVLDFRHKKPSEAISEYDVASELERIGCVPNKNNIVMLWTGGTDHFDDDPHFGDSAAGMAGGALHYLFQYGIKVMSTDSATIDMPLSLMGERLMKGDKTSYMAIHRAGRLKEWTHAEKLANMGSLPGPSGFKVMFFPVKISHGTGAWIRAVAIEDEWLNSHQIQLVDLSLPIMNHSFEHDESRIITSHHAQSGRTGAKRRGILVADLPHHSAMDVVETYTHAGTHVAAPYHFGPTHGGKRSMTADELPLDRFYADGVLLDFSQGKRPGDKISVSDIRGELDRIHYSLKAGDIVLIRTGADDRFDNDPFYPEWSLAMEREALFWILDEGVKVIGCDAESLDGPLEPMA